MDRKLNVCIGIDVGGTSTDAVALLNGKVVAKSKQPTTALTTIGVKNALGSVLQQLARIYDGSDVGVCRVNIGTTYFLNAVLQRKGLAPVSVIRLCGPASRSLPPFCDFPQDLRHVVCKSYHFVDGGYEFNGKEIAPVRPDEVLQVIKELKENGAKHLVVSGIFSITCDKQELDVGDLLRIEYPEASFTMSHQIANLGLLDRENSSILNECLKPLSKTAMSAFTEVVRDFGLACPVYFTQNDGTIISAEKSLQFPVFTFSSGPTNSMRGAAFLSGKQDAIVIDIGGTTTDVGVLVGGFPRLSSTKVNCGGVTTNFQMPDVFSFALGGGSIVSNHESKPVIGPHSVGNELNTKSLVFGGSISTTTDFAVAAGLCNIGEASKVLHLDNCLVDAVMISCREILEYCIDHVKVCAGDQHVILVGGGVALVDVTKSLQGASFMTKPEHFEVANAVGAALSQVSGVVDHVFDMSCTTREKALEKGQALAKKRCVYNGAQVESVVIVEKTEIQLAYLKGHALRLKVKAVGDLGIDKNQQSSLVSAASLEDAKDRREIDVKNNRTEISSSEDELQETGLDTKILSIDVKIAELNVDRSSGEWLLNEYDVNCIATGAGILGCGGGGDPYLGRLSAILALRSGKELRIIHPDSLPHRGLVIPVGFMGAPSIFIEKIFAGDELLLAAEKMQIFLSCNEKDLEYTTSKRGVKYVKNLPSNEVNKIENDKRIVGVMCAEIGGVNAILPLVLGAQLGLPVVDCDGMGRAFPQLEMFVPSIEGLPLCPSTIVASQTSSKVITYCATAQDLENDLRELIVAEMGCMAGLTMAPLTREEIHKHTVMFSISRAWTLGNAVKMAQKEKQCPVKAILDSQNGKLLITGKITDVDRRTEDGFTKGVTDIDGLDKFANSSMKILFKNENIVAKIITCDGEAKVSATVPDLISILDSQSGEVIPNEEVRYGLRVSVIVLPCSPLLRTEKALKIVGPHAFGYQEYSYEACGVYEETRPIPTFR